MLDTGAESTLVEQALADQLGLQPTRFVPVVGVSAKPERCPVYPLGITIKFADVENLQAELTFAADVIGMPAMAGSLHRGLLGRDFLRHFEMLYDGPHGLVELRVSQELRSSIPPPPISLVSKGSAPSISEEQKRRRRNRTKSAKRARRNNR